MRKGERSHSSVQRIGLEVVVVVVVVVVVDRRFSECYAAVLQTTKGQIPAENIVDIVGKKGQDPAPFWV